MTEISALNFVPGVELHLPAISVLALYCTWYIFWEPTMCGLPFAVVSDASITSHLRIRRTAAV